jgi:hypothetical protein
VQYVTDYYNIRGNFVDGWFTVLFRKDCFSPGVKMDPPAPFTDHTHYRYYLLRLWRAGEEGAPALRILLVSPHTGERWSFTSLAEMVEFLEREMGEEQEQGKKG